MFAHWTSGALKRAFCDDLNFVTSSCAVFTMTFSFALNMYRAKLQLFSTYAALKWISFINLLILTTKAVINVWNNLPKDVVQAGSLTSHHVIWLTIIIKWPNPWVTHFKMITWRLLEKICVSDFEKYTIRDKSVEMSPLSSPFIA